LGCKRGTLGRHGAGAALRAGHHSVDGLLIDRHAADAEEGNRLHRLPDRENDRLAPRAQLGGGSPELRNLAADGRLAGFAMPYLGQQDAALPWIPPDLVRREQVASYPTNFAPMSGTEIDRLTLRGEQLMHLHIERWSPDF
jgi:NTE family protein